MLNVGDMVRCKLEDKPECILRLGGIYVISKAVGQFVRLTHTGAKEWHIDRFELIETVPVKYSPYYEAITGGPDVFPR